MTLSNVEPLVDAETEPMPETDITLLYADLEKLPVADASYDVVLAHEVLHHCRSPHAALVEMLRVSRRNIVLMEPNDSLAMRWLMRLRFSTSYELPAVIYNNYEKGGVNNTDIPNFIYRWDPRTIYQTVAACLPEREFGLYLRRYWDFNITAEELERRRETRIGAITKVVGPRRFIALLHGFQAVANHLPWIAGQGNKFFACITKQHALKPWIVERNGGSDSIEHTERVNLLVRLNASTPAGQFLDCAPAQVAAMRAGLRPTDADLYFAGALRPQNKSF